MEWILIVKVKVESILIIKCPYDTLNSYAIFPVELVIYWFE